MRGVSLRPLRRNPPVDAASTSEVTGRGSSVIVCLGGSCSRRSSRDRISAKFVGVAPAFWLKRRDTETHTQFIHTHTHASQRATPGRALCQCYGGGPGVSPVINNGNCAKLSLGGNVRPVRSRTSRPFRTCGFYCLRCHAARSLSITISFREPPWIRFVGVYESRKSRGIHATVVDKRNRKMYNNKCIYKNSNAYSDTHWSWIAARAARQLSP